MTGRKWFRALAALLLVILTAVPAMAAINIGSDPPQTGGDPGTPAAPADDPTLPLQIAFGEVRSLTYNQTQSPQDLNLDGTPDILITPTTVTGKNGTLLWIDQRYWSLDQVTTVPRTGYAETQPTQTNRVYVAQLPGGVYAKIRLKVTASTVITFDWSIGKSDEAVPESENKAGALSGLPPITVAVAPTSIGDRMWKTPLSTGEWTVALNDAGVGIKLSAYKVTTVNGAHIQYLPGETDYAALSRLPVYGYSDSADLVNKGIYAITLPDGRYAKLQYWTDDPSSSGHPALAYTLLYPDYNGLVPSSLPGDVVLRWTALPDANLGYYVYRWESAHPNAASATQLNDLPISDLFFDDLYAEGDKSYIYVVSAVKADGQNGSYTGSTTVTAEPTPKTLTVSLKDGTATVNNLATLSLDAKPVIKNGRMMLPVSLLSQVGFKVVTDTSAGTVTLSRISGRTIYTMIMNLGSLAYSAGGGTLWADAPPYLAGTTVMVPIRTVAAGLRLSLVFNPSDRSATVTWFE